MKFDPGKSWPWPVLREGSSDYRRSAFEVEIVLTRLEGTTDLELEAEFWLSDADLLRLVEERRAEYVLLMQCPKTHFRVHLSSLEPRIVRRFDEGRIAGLTEISPFLICREPLAGLRGSNWHEDYADRFFDLGPGSVLAVEPPSQYWVDTAEEGPVASIFLLVRDDDVPEGQWRCVPGDERVELKMGSADHQRFLNARGRAAVYGTEAYILNGVYLPALVWLLSHADRDSEGNYEGCRWFEVVNAALERAGCEPLQSAGQDRLFDAQKLFEWPFAKLPLLVDEDADR